MASGIGCKGGTSATAGKKRASYSWTYPDGSRGEYRSFKANSETAFAVCYQSPLNSGTAWYVSGVYDAVPGWAARPGHGGQPYTIIEAKREAK